MDAEFFDPQYVAAQEKVVDTKKYQPWAAIDGKFIAGPFGSEFNVENYIENGKFRYIRGKDVKDFFLEDDDNVYIPEKDFQRLKKYSLQDGDILISVVGTPGCATIVDASVPPAIFSCKSTAFRSIAINPYYFIAYLNSSFGQSLMQRSIRGAVQTGLNIGDLKNLPIFTPSKAEQSTVADYVKYAKQAIEESKQFYSKAEELLLEELGLKDTKFGEDLAYSTKFSDIKAFERMDADYFQPKYKKLKDFLQKYGTEELPEVVENVSAKFDPTKKPQEIFRYVELGNINVSLGVIDDYSEVSGKELPSRAKRMLKAGDVIISSIEGSLEKSALVDKEQEGFLASTGFFQFRSDGILPEVLLIMAKSIVFQWQLKQKTAGTILTAVPKESIQTVLVPILPKAIQQKIADLVRQSHGTRKKSKEFLESAKHKVEELIEKGGGN